VRQKWEESGMALSRLETLSEEVLDNEQGEEELEEEGVFISTFTYL